MELNPEEAWNSFRDLFKSVDNHAPVNIRRVRGRSLPWITRKVKALVKERDYYHKKAIRQTKRFTGAATKDYVMLLPGNYGKKKAIIVLPS